VPATVLVVEDDAVALELVRLYLQKDGHKVITASKGTDGLRLALEAHPDLVVLDLMLPGIDGLEICRRLRQESSVPIVMLTARVEEEDRLAGLDLGADDYITKPFSPRELAARVRAVLRRTDRESRESGAKGMTYKDIALDQTNRRVEVGGKAISLTPTEFRLLAMFMREPGCAFTRDQIIDRAFGYDFDGFDRTVDAHVSNLRRKLGVDSESWHYIQAVYGVGYRFGRE